MSLPAEYKEKDDLNNPFGHENYAYDQGEKNDSEQRIADETECSQAIQSSDEGMPREGAPSEMNSEREMSYCCDEKEPP